MYCGHCGSPLPETANFCPKCGAKTEGVTKAAPTGRWKAETEKGEITDFNPAQLDPVLGLIAAGEWEFLILTPPSAIEGTRFIQACSDGHGRLHVELCYDRGIAGYELRGIDGITVLDGVAMMERYLAGTVPVLPEGQAWKLI